MSAYWWLGAVALVIGFTLAQVQSAKFVQHLTGRESRPVMGRGATAELYYGLVYFGLALGIGLPPIHLLPDADPLVHCFFCFVGITIGSIAAQLFFGRKVA